MREQAQVDINSTELIEEVTELPANALQFIGGGAATVNVI
jgi:hypothetical protein